jgi:hypothetical protein
LVAQVPPLQNALAAQLPSLLQPMPQIVPLQSPGAQIWVAAAGQLVLTPVQVAASVATPALQAGPLHWVPALPAGWEQAPAVQRSVVQGLPSPVQLVPSGKTLQLPVAALQTPGWQSSLGQTTAAPAQTPLAQLSPVVHRLWSSQPVPLAATSQTPAALHVPG